MWCELQGICVRFRADFTNGMGLSINKLKGVSSLNAHTVMSVLSNISKILYSSALPHKTRLWILNCLSDSSHMHLNAVQLRNHFPSPVWKKTLLIRSSCRIALSQKSAWLSSSENAISCSATQSKQVPSLLQVSGMQARRGFSTFVFLVFSIVKDFHVAIVLVGLNRMLGLGFWQLWSCPFRKVVKKMAKMK